MAAAAENFSKNLQFFRDNSAYDKSNSLSALKGLSIDLRDEKNRVATPGDFIDGCNSLMTSLISEMRNITETDPLLRDKFDEVVQNLELVGEVYRCLRNCCAGCKRNQLAITRNEAFLGSTKDYIAQLLHFHHTTPSLAEFSLPEQTTSLVFQCLYSVVQCLGNTVTACPENHEPVWSQFSAIFLDLLKLSDLKLTNYLCMVLFNCNTESVRRTQLTSVDGWRILGKVLEAASHEDIEWGVFYLEGLMARPELFTVAYKELEDTERLVLLDFVHAEVSASLGKGDVTPDSATVHHQLPSESLRALGKEFRDNAHLILGTSGQAGRYDSIGAPELVLKVLDVLCTATAVDGDYASIQDDKDLLKCCIHLLHTMFMIGQQGDNPFTSKKLSQMSDKDNDHTHPTYGLKRDLIQLIGNMVHGNKENQDQVREIGGIPLILDHANIDGRNPFILQWTIFTIRNLCENNAKNQDIIANMNLQGVANSAEMLRDFGVDATVKDGKVVVKSEEKR